MILFGAGGHAAVVFDTLSALSISVFYIIDDNDNTLEFEGIKILPSTSLEESVAIDRKTMDMIVCIGDSHSRAEIVHRYPGPFGKALHPSASLADSISIGTGSVVFHHAVIQTRSKIGQHVIVNTAACIDHECEIGDFAHIAPQCTLCGGVSVGNYAEIGAASTITPGISIGEGAVVGAGSVVTRDIPANSVAVGVPAEVIKQLPNT